MSKTRTELTSAIMTQNVISFSLVQTQMEKNFKTIVEALKEYDNDLSLMLNFNSETEKKLDQFGNHIEQSNKKQENMQKEIDMMKQMMKELGEKQKQKDNSSHENPQIKAEKQDYSKLKERIENLQKKQNSQGGNLKKMLQDIENMKKDINKISSDESQKNQKQIPFNSKYFENQIKKIALQNNKNRLLIQQLQSRGGGDNNQGQITQVKEKLEKFIQEEYEPTKKDIYEQLSTLQNGLQQNIKDIEEEKRLRTRLNDEMWRLNDIIYEKQREKMDGEFNADLIKKMQGQIMEIRKRVSGNEHTDKNMTLNSTNVQKNTNQTFTERQSPSKINKEDNSTEQSFRKEIIDKLNDQKHFFLKTYKKLQNTNQNQSQKQKLIKLEDAVMRLDYLMNEKSDINTVKKLLGYLQNKIAYVFNIVTGQGNEQDACIARKNWTCLSCEKRLDKYQGKVGSHLITGQLRSKILENEAVGGGMQLKGSKSKVDLPNVYKVKKNKQ